MHGGCVGAVGTPARKKRAARVVGTLGRLWVSPTNGTGAPSGARTLGTLIKSQVLYQLS